MYKIGDGIEKSRDECQINLKCMPERISASPGVSLALSG